MHLLRDCWSLARVHCIQGGCKSDPLKVEAILQLSPPRNIRHLQCLQGMENFLWRFVVNFSNLTKGFMRLLKDTPFYWDERVLAGIFHVMWTTRCSIGLNGSDLEKIEDRG